MTRIPRTIVSSIAVAFAPLEPVYEIRDVLDFGRVPSVASCDDDV